MFGRDFDSANLLNLTNYYTDPQSNADQSTHESTSHLELHIPMTTGVTDTHELSDIDGEWIESLADIRNTNRMEAVQNIKSELTIQKKKIDCKVKRNR